MTATVTDTVTVTVSVPITHPGSLAVLLQVQNCSSSIWDKSSNIKIGQWGRPWLVWYVPCKRRCVPRFTKLKHRHHHRRWRCESHSVGTRWQSVAESVNRTTLCSLSQTNYHSNHRKMTVKCVTTIPCIDPADLSINIDQYFRLTDQNAKLFTRNHDMCFAEKSARMRPGCSHWSIACGVI